MCVVINERVSQSVIDVWAGQGVVFVVCVGVRAGDGDGRVSRILAASGLDGSWELSKASKRRLIRCPWVVWKARQPQRPVVRSLCAASLSAQRSCQRVRETHQAGCFFVLIWRYPMLFARRLFARIFGVYACGWRTCCKPFV